MMGMAEARIDSIVCVLGISELRQEAHEEGLIVDGSRKMLIAALSRAPNLDIAFGLCFYKFYLQTS